MILKASKSLAGIGGLCVVAGLLGVSGCSHDTLKTATVGLAITYTPSVTGTGRYEHGTFGITDVRLVPADPARRSLIDPNNLSLNATMNIDLTSTATASLTHVALTPGVYNVVSITFNPPVLTDDNPPAVPATCLEGVAVLPGPPLVPPPLPPITFGEADGYTIDVVPGKTTIDFRVDVPALIAGYEAAFTCQPSCNGDGACVTAFDQNAFRTVLRNVVTIQ